MAVMHMLPEGCIANVLSLTSPKDACRLSLVATTFRSAADSDVVWEKFLPSDYKDIIARSTTVNSPPPPHSKKQLYFWLSDHPLIIDRGTKSFSLEKRGGKKCYMLAARDLTIVWVDTPQYWIWTPLPDSRFGEVAELRGVCWLEIRGKINMNALSRNTTYTAFLVFRSTAEAYGLEYQPAEVSVGIRGGETKIRTVYLEPHTGHTAPSRVVQRPRSLFLPRVGFFNRVAQRHVLALRGSEADEEGVKADVEDGLYPKVRGDGWMEIELGDYFVNGGGGGGGEEEDDRELEMSLMEVKGGHWKSGLLVLGIEIRPKIG